MKASRTVTYAVQALLLLSQHEKKTPVPCSLLSKDGEMPERFLLQILRHLVNAGILKSVRGVEGGYLLAREPETITLRDIIEAVEGPLVQPAEDREKLPGEAYQKLHRIYASITSRLREDLGRITLQLLADSPDKAPFDSGFLKNL